MSKSVAVLSNLLLAYPKSEVLKNDDDRKWHGQRSCANAKAVEWSEMELEGVANVQSNAPMHSPQCEERIQSK
jgi:hypothetical protein